MKKIFSILAAALLCTSLSAQKLEEGFEGEQFAPEGWTVVANHNYPSFSSWNRVVKNSENPRMTTNSGEACAYVNQMEGADNWLITPQLCPTEDDVLLFAARVAEYAAGAELQVLLSTTGTNIEDFQIELGALPTSQSASDPRLFKEWRTYQLPMEEFVGQRIFIAFRQYDQYSAERIYLDDISGVTLAGTASCPNPTGVKLTAVTANRASFAWEGEASQYQYCCVPAGAGADWSGAEKVAEKSVTVSGLSENTAYDFYVRSYCSDEEQSLAPKVAFSTICPANEVPWIETFTGHPTSSGFNVVSPECWFVASENPSVAVVISKSSSDDYEESSAIAGSEHLYITGGGTYNPQVFAMPAFNEPLNELEVAFDYYHSFAGANYGTLEVGYITNPTDAKTFVAIKSLLQMTSKTHIVQTLEGLPEEAQFIAFRFAGGTSDLGALHMDNFIVAEIGHSDEMLPQGLNNVQSDKLRSAKRIENGALIIEHNGLRYNAQGAIVQ